LAVFIATSYALMTSLYDIATNNSIYSIVIDKLHCHLFGGNAAVIPVELCQHKSCNNLASEDTADQRCPLNV